jgi:hypothetical protein
MATENSPNTLKPGDRVLQIYASCEHCFRASNYVFTIVSIGKLTKREECCGVTFHPGLLVAHDGVTDGGYAIAVPLSWLIRLDDPGETVSEPEHVEIER